MRPGVRAVTTPNDRTEHEARAGSSAIAERLQLSLDEVPVRESEMTVGEALEFDFGMLAGFDAEARIERLTAWVLAAEAAMRSYALTIPGARIGPGLGLQHRHACLRTLALMPHAPV